MEYRHYRCNCCGSMVKRAPGHRHGDGQIDSDDHPIYLLVYTDEQLAHMGDVDRLGLCYAVINDCGCKGEPDWPT